MPQEVSTSCTESRSPTVRTLNLSLVFVCPFVFAVRVRITLPPAATTATKSVAALQTSLAFYQAEFGKWIPRCLQKMVHDENVSLELFHSSLRMQTC